MSVKTVEIVTAHHIAIDYELASLSDRIIALIIDSAIVLFYGIIVFLIIKDFSEDTKTVARNLFFLPAIFIYHLLSEIFFNGQSIGKKSMGIKVVRMNGHNPTVGDCLLRWCLRIIDIGASIGALAAILVSSTDKSQRLGDLAANTVVVRLNPPNRYTINDILTINTAKDYSPTYKEVTQFTDEDMLLIKNAIERTKIHPNESNKKLIHEITIKVKEKLKISEEPKDKIKFLRTILHDYIVLTR